MSTTNLKYCHLLVEAVSEVKPKWRFLAVYRLLEHGYLSEAFQTLAADFFSSPKESLDAAQKSVASELKQFVALADAAQLQAQFETFHDEFDRCKLTGNTFAVALERSAQRSGQAAQFQGKWQVGVLLCYKIRCAIVHAGLSAPIYDAYADGPKLVESLLPCVESIGLTFLGVTIQ